MTHVSVRAGLVGVAVGSAVLLGACTQAPSQADRSTAPAVVHLTWQRVALPHSLSPVTLATTGDLVLVGAFAAERPRPHLLAGPDATALREVPLTPRSPYAFEAHWFGIATRGDRIDAIAGARG